MASATVAGDSGQAPAYAAEKVVELGDRLIPLLGPSPTDSIPDGVLSLTDKREHVGFTTFEDNVEPVPPGAASGSQRTDENALVVPVGETRSVTSQVVMPCPVSGCADAQDPGAEAEQLQVDLTATTKELTLTDVSQAIGEGLDASGAAVFRMAIRLGEVDRAAGAAPRFRCLLAVATSRSSYRDYLLRKRTLTRFTKTVTFCYDDNGRVFNRRFKYDRDDGQERGYRFIRYYDTMIVPAANVFVTAPNWAYMGWTHRKKIQWQRGNYFDYIDACIDGSYFFDRAEYRTCQTDGGGYDSIEEADTRYVDPYGPPPS